jgi:hypothetical protein
MIVYLETDGVELDEPTQKIKSGLDKIKDKFEGLPVPNVIPEEKAICVYNNKGERICYMLPTRDVIQCDTELCKVNYRTNDRSILSKHFPKGIRVGLRPYGAFSSVHVFGTFEKQVLPIISEMFGYIDVENVDNVAPPSFDLPKPPKSCRWAIWSDKCQPYIKDLSWNWGIFRGWRRNL